jgi:hypothetical protein
MLSSVVSFNMQIGKFTSTLIRLETGANDTKRLSGAAHALGRYAVTYNPSSGCCTWRIVIKRAPGIPHLIHVYSII